MKQFQNNSDFDDFLRSKLHQSAINPPNGQWGAINRVLIKKRRQKWAFRLSAVAVLLLMLYQTAFVFTPIGFDMPEVALSSAPYRSFDEKSGVLDNNWKEFNKEALPQAKTITQDINLALLAGEAPQSAISVIEDKKSMSKELATYIKVQPIKVPAFLPKKEIPPLLNKPLEPAEQGH